MRFRAPQWTSTEFQSDDDGRNDINDGFKGIGFNNITLQEYAFVQDAVYTDSRTNVDAEEAATTVIASHEFFSGVYRQVSRPSSTTRRLESRGTTTTKS